jgi:hypothetical protein
MNTFYLVVLYFSGLTVEPGEIILSRFEKETDALDFQSSCMMNQWLHLYSGDTWVGIKAILKDAYGGPPATLLTVAGNPPFTY